MKAVILFIAVLLTCFESYALVVSEPPTRLLTCVAFDESTNKMSPGSRAQFNELLKINGGSNGIERWAIGAAIYSKESLEKTQQQLLRIYEELPIGRVANQRVSINISVISGNDSYYRLDCPSLERSVELTVLNPSPSFEAVCPKARRCRIECEGNDKCEIKLD